MITDDSLENFCKQVRGFPFRGMPLHQKDVAHPTWLSHKLRSLFSNYQEYGYTDLTQFHLKYFLNCSLCVF
jgi:hypothetical protein